MKKATLFIAAFLMAGAMKAQDSVTLDLQFMPNKKYTQLSGQDTNMEMSFGDNASTMKMSMSANNIIETEGVKAGSIPLTMQTGTTINMDMEGMPPNNTEISMKLTGIVKEGEIIPIFKTVQSADLTEEMKGQTLELMSKMMEKMDFPKKTLKVGESFVTETPVDIPMGSGSMKMMDKANYKLVKVEGGKAYFDITHDVALDLAVQGSDMKGSGTGTGKMIYEIAAKYPVSLTNNIDMSLNLEQGGMSIEVKMNSQQNQNTSISNR